MKGRNRPLRAAPGELKVYYGPPEGGEPPDLSFVWGDGVGKRRAHLMHSLLGPFLKFPEGCIVDGMGRQDFAKALDDAGFDLSTLKLTIRMKPPSTENAQRLDQESE